MNGFCTHSDDTPDDVVVACCHHLRPVRTNLYLSVLTPPRYRHTHGMDKKLISLKIQYTVLKIDCMKRKWVRGRILDTQNIVDLP